MKRVSFTFGGFGVNWLGGINYFRSLLHAIAVRPNQDISPVLVVSPRQLEEARSIFPEAREILATPLVERGRLAHYTRRGIDYLLGRDILMEQFYLRHGIDVSSHGPALGRASRIPSLIWIPDFQHIHLPHFFPPKEITRRNRRMKRDAVRATRIILSSENAKQDLVKLLPGSVDKIRILRFSPKIDTPTLPDGSVLRGKYGLSGKYLFLPNQLWAHKNHTTVINALASLMDTHRDINVVCTGAMVDDRNPGHIAEIEKLIRSHRLEASFRLLGVVPYADMAGLMAHAHAVINPSLFEGWSTTVEEAKLLGKSMILSDIPVHREQSGDRALFFPPLDHVACAGQLLRSWREPVRPYNERFVESMRTAGAGVGDEFARIVLDACAH